MEDMEDLFDFDKKKFRDPDQPVLPTEIGKQVPYPPFLQKKIDEPKIENERQNPAEYTTTHPRCLTNPTTTNNARLT